MLFEIISVDENLKSHLRGRGHVTLIHTNTTLIGPRLGTNTNCFQKFLSESDTNRRNYALCTNLQLL